MPECYVDTNLIEYLLAAKVNHQHCCSKVVGQLKTTFANQFAVGIIDRDKVELGYIKECDVIAQTTHICLMKHKNRCQFLITIRPAIDGFVLDCAEELGVDMADFELPSSLKEFTKVTKSVTSNVDKRFKNLFKDLEQHWEISILKRCLLYLSKEKYQAKVDTLKEIFSNQ
jgi:hypothetical protein